MSGYIIEVPPPVLAAPCNQIHVRRRHHIRGCLYSTYLLNSDARNHARDQKRPKPEPESWKRITATHPGNQTTDGCRSDHCWNHQQSHHVCKLVLDHELGLEQRLKKRCLRRRSADHRTHSLPQQTRVLPHVLHVHHDDHEPKRHPHLWCENHQHHVPELVVVHLINEQKTGKDVQCCHSSARGLDQPLVPDHHHDVSTR
mmetsp:Transcript_34513/g.83298  ORF Transcript_34513/g.83298 Transcript_34513/m.83298 type:complete len:200 (-) Transcript_34513:3-602(-)